MVSSSRIHDAFTKPRLPTWGLVQMLVAELADRTPEADAVAEVKRFHALWDAAAEADSCLPATDESGSAQEAALGAHHSAVTDGPAVGGYTQASLLLATFEGFSGRDDLEQAHMRRMLFDLLQGVAEAAGVDPATGGRVDLGDGVIELIDAAVPMANLLRAVLAVVPAELRTVNRLASDSAQIRLRLALVTGIVRANDITWWRSVVDGSYRLLDSEAMRAALRSGKDAY
ncbi:hypothetical protein ACIPY6_41695 [Streptomyces sp. NPDC090054]|uniref:hypothetical protein n=1 Tax=Streptomyces sp. NPDC090054 TaxID=3365933 RepID=UPI00380E4774